MIHFIHKQHQILGQDYHEIILNNVSGQWHSFLIGMKFQEEHMKFQEEHILEY